MRCLFSWIPLSAVVVGLYALPSCSSAPDGLDDDGFDETFAEDDEWVIAGQPDAADEVPSGPDPAPRDRPPTTSGRAPERPGSGQKAAPPSERGPSTPTVRGILQRLADRDETVSSKTFWKLSEIDKAFIPELIDHIQNEFLSSVTELSILVKYDRTPFRGQLISRIPGMGKVEDYEQLDGTLRIYGREYDREIRVGSSKNGLKVRIEKADGFPIGVVLRAALINRFRSVDYPRRVDHHQNLERWWREYYRRVLRSGELNLKVPGRVRK